MIDDNLGYDPLQEAAALSEAERRFLVATPVMEPADAGFIALSAGYAGGGHRFAGFARRQTWLFQRPFRHGHLSYRLSADGAEIRRAIEREEAAA